MTDQELYDRLSAFISPNKRSLFDRIAPERTRHVTLVLEDIYQPHNASAVLRTCDLVGIQDVHVIEQRNRYTVNPDIALGSSKWVDIIPHRGAEDNSMRCVRSLREKGYRIVATTPGEGSFTPEDLPIDEPVAICFGTELTGLSEEVIHMADMRLRIPMHGFTESYNISVSAALVSYTLMQRLRASRIAWRLSDAERTRLKVQWTRNVLHSAEMIEQRIREGARREDAGNV